MSVALLRKLMFVTLFVNQQATLIFFEMVEPKQLLFARCIPALEVANPGCYIKLNVRTSIPKAILKHTHYLNLTPPTHFPLPPDRMLVITRFRLYVGSPRFHSLTYAHYEGGRFHVACAIEILHIPDR